MTEKLYDILNGPADEQRSLLLGTICTRVKDLLRPLDYHGRVAFFDRQDLRSLADSFSLSGPLDQIANEACGYLIRAAFKTEADRFLSLLQQVEPEEEIYPGIRQDLGLPEPSTSPSPTRQHPLDWDLFIVG